MMSSGPISPYHFMFNVLIVFGLVWIFSELIFRYGARLAMQIYNDDTAKLEEAIGSDVPETQAAAKRRLRAERRQQIEQSLPIGYNILWYGVGGLWLLAGILQAQPMMFTHSFVSGVLGSAANVQIPALLSWQHGLMEFWSKDPVKSNIDSLTIQLFIGALLLVYRKNPWIGPTALGASIIWGTLVWAFGEGFGNTFANGASFIMQGTPGGVLMYVLAAVLLMLPKRWWIEGYIRTIGLWMLISLWVLGVLWQIAPVNGYWSAAEWRSALTSELQMSQPHWVASGIDSFMSVVTAHPVLVNAIASALMLAVAVLLYFRRTRHVAVVVSLVFLFFAWWMGQDFGVLGGLGTDVNLAPLVALFMLSFVEFGKSRRRQRVSRLSHQQA
ncbi:MAG: hypothetical protein OWS03_09950 [Alicyclobacillaceae bacterium]|nr:hypothetical protein [Alicyclobacillaceae bacterium]